MWSHSSRRRSDVVNAPDSAGRLPALRRQNGRLVADETLTTAGPVVASGSSVPPRPSQTSPPPAPGWPFGKVFVLALAVGLLGLVAGWVFAQPDPPSESSVDVGFLRDMIDHHDQAVYMAQITVSKPGIDNTVRAFAQEVLIAQRWEIGRMDAWLDDWGLLRGDPDRTAMRWMGMSSSVPAMPGMQPEERVDELVAATGPDANRLFLTMMKDHHQGGVHMAKDAARHAGSKKVRELADTMARNQETEIREYEQVMARLGIPA
jgi:uncharacterized protein (DUF305 family)